MDLSVENDYQLGGECRLVANVCQLEFCKNLITMQRGGARYRCENAEGKAPPFRKKL
jgi:hypothetical protein